MQELRYVRDIKLIDSWAELRPRHGVGGLARRGAVSALRADVLYMSSTAISGGVAYQPDQDMAIAKRAMIAAAGGGAAGGPLQVWPRRFASPGAVDRFDLVMTDDGIDDAGLRQVQEAQVASRS